jgi:cytochrome c551/c552
MKSKLVKALKIGLPALVVLAVAIQFVPVVRDNPPVTGDLPGPPEAKALLKRACYNCHSNETVWPGYSRIAPISWFVASDVHEGRGLFNFSQWGETTADQRTAIRQNVWRMIEKGAMPPWDYSLMHSDAKLTDTEKATLKAWANAPAAAATPEAK